MKAKRMNPKTRGGEWLSKRAVARRLAQSFKAPAWGTGPELGSDDAANILGCIEPEEVEVLCRVGVLRADGDKIPLAELLRFLEQHGKWWFQVRLEKQIHALKEDIARTERRASLPSESRGPKLVSTAPPPRRLSAA